MTTSEIEIHPLSPDRSADFMAFFEGEAFSDNPKWSSCYCPCFYEDHSKVHWPSRTAAENRACASQRIADGQMQGLLAYREGQVVGWCNAAPHLLLRALDAEPMAKPERVGTIRCFLVAPSARSQGVANTLLHAARPSVGGGEPPPQRKRNGRESFRAAGHVPCSRFHGAAHR